MNLREAILTCNEFKDTEEIIHSLFAQKINNTFSPDSDAIVLQLTLPEIAMRLADISSLKCPGYDYFLEISILQEFIEDINHLPEYKSDEQKIERIIYYAEHNA